jgi:DNA-binding response OmpR family regulator
MCKACSAQTRIVLGSVVVDLGALRIRRGRRNVRLTAAEAALLFMLVARANQLVRNEELVAALHGPASFAHGRARVKFVIVQLRRKLGRARSCLETVHGRGYVLKLAGKERPKSRRRRPTS